MPLLLRTLAGKISLRRLGGCAVLMTATALFGCTSLESYRGERFPHDELFDNVQQFRYHRDQVEPTAFSNKARQIDQSCGGSR
jgi:hypothetical protein